MTWVDELLEKSYFNVNGVVVLKKDDLVLAVLEERNRIEEVVLKEPVCAKGSIRHHEYARSFKSLLEKCEELNKK